MNGKSTPPKRRSLISLAFAFIVVTSLMAVPFSNRSTTLTGMRSYIVQGVNTDQVTLLVEHYGGQVTSMLPIIHGVGALLTQESNDALQKEMRITAITPNSPVKTAGHSSPTTDYPEVVGADMVWEQGNLGSGITVAIVDTGLGKHTGLFTDINGNNKTRIVGWYDLVENSRKPSDPNGHGAHVAGIIANTQKDAKNQWEGIAPGVNLVGVRVLDREGAGTYERVIQGIQWVLDHQAEYNIRVMNLSLVSPVQSPYWADPLNQAVMQAWSAGIVVVAAAGNGGSGSMSVGVPGNNPYVITVGAFTDNYTPLDWSDDYIAPFSAAGPTLDGFVKPDVVAPGGHMVSSMLSNSYLAHAHEANKINSTYFSMAGTSQATGVVSGIVALTLAQHPELTPNQVKYRVMNTAFLWVDINTTEALYSIWQQGAGRVNAPDSVYADITGEANAGMDITADLAGATHYEGYSFYDETAGLYRMHADFDTWDGGYWAWDGGYGAWSGGYGAWSGGYGAWSGGYGAWSGGYGAWSGGYGAWSGGYGAWSGGYGAWSGGYGAWSGGYGAWSGSEPWAGTIFADSAFVEIFLAGVVPDATISSCSINNWVEEP